MNLLLPLMVLTATAISLSTSAPTNHLHKFKLSMRNQPSEYPLKGEYPCKGGICSTKPKAVNECEDCQFAKPLLIGEWETKK